MSFLADLDPELDSLPTNPGMQVQVGNTIITGSTLGQLVDRLEPVLDDDRILEIVREQTSFQQRFPVIYADGRTDLTPGDVVAYERRVTETFRAFDLPPSFYDDPVEDIQGFIRNDVSINEVEDRIAVAQSFTEGVSDLLIEELEARSGIRINSGDLTAFILDPDRAEAAITQNFAQAQAASQFRQTGFSLSESQLGRLTSTADDLSTQGLQDQSNITSRALSLRNLLGAGSTVTGDDVVGAALGEADAQNRVESEITRRGSRFEGSGGFATTNSGVAGLGVSR